MVSLPFVSTCENSRGIFWQVNQFIIPHLTPMNEALASAHQRKRPKSNWSFCWRRKGAATRLPPEGAGLALVSRKYIKCFVCTFQTLKCGGETRQPRYIYINACCVCERGDEMAAGKFFIYAHFLSRSDQHAAGQLSSLSPCEVYNFVLLRDKKQTKKWDINMGRFYLLGN